MDSKDPNWWRQAVVYQIYPRSFADANGDGIGDLKGITSRVGYLRDLGVDAVWLSPFYPSALKDGGYDVADYRAVDPRIGTLDDFDEMMAAMKEANIKVVVDIVPNHSSDDHEWFQAALKDGKGSEARDKYIFRDGTGPDKTEPPNDWESYFSGSAWEPSGSNDGQFYFHLFDKAQPDFNWENPAVRADFLHTLRFWADRGVAGFRVDVAAIICKDFSDLTVSHVDSQATSKRLRLAGAERGDGKQHPYEDRDETLEVYKEWRKVFNEYDPPLTAVGEIFVAPDRKPLYASPETLGQAFAFDAMIRNFNANEFRECVDNQLGEVDLAQTSTTWVLSSHDAMRHASRYGLPQIDWRSDLMNWQKSYGARMGESEWFDACDKERGRRRATAATLFLFGLPGSTYIYQGEELGLLEVIDMPDSERQDPMFFRGMGRGRDGCRVPLPWTHDGPSHGFGPGDKSHLPMPEGWGENAVDIQDKNERSSLNIYRKALALRRELQGKETIEWVDNPNEQVVHFRRPAGWEVVTNFGAELVDMPPGKVLLVSEVSEDGKLPGEATAWLKA